MELDLEFYKTQVKFRDIKRILLCLRDVEPENRQKYIDMIPEGITKDLIVDVCKSTKSIENYLDNLYNKRIDEIERTYSEMGC